MKGKLNIRFDAPNIGRLRSRVESPSKELTAQIRQALNEVACEVLNESQLAIKSKMIEKVASLGLKYQSANHELQVNNVLGDIFSTVVASSAEGLAAISGKPLADASEEEEADSVEEATEADDDDEFDA